MSRATWCFAVLSLFAACGTPETCDTETCTNGKTYTACSPSGSTLVNYTYGGATCSCDSMQPAEQACVTCRQSVAAYCM